MEILPSIMNKLESHRPKKIYIQVPEGLKTKVLDIASAIEERGIDVIIGCDPTYGACDLRDKEAKALGCDLLLHIGHTGFGIKACLPVIYEDYEIEIDPLPLLEKHIKNIPFKRLSLLTSAQFSSLLEPARLFLEKEGKKVVFAKQIKNKREGLLLGCDWTAALPLEDKIDGYLFVGSGRFHPLGLARHTNKTVLSLNLESGELTDFTKEKRRLEQIKAFHIEEAKEKEKFGILLTMKQGQMLLKAAEQTKKTLEKLGKSVCVLAMDEITPEKIMGMDLDVLVNCACPRIDEDTSLFKKPILNPQDVLKLTH